MIRLICGIAALLVCTISAPLNGQPIGAPVDPFGRIFSATIRPEVQVFGREALAARESQAFVLGSLGVRDSDSATSGSFSFGYGNNMRGRDFFLNGTYSRVNLESGDERDRASAYGQLVLLPEGFASISAIALAAYDAEAFKTYGLVLAAEKAFLADRLTAAANLGWTEIDPKAGGTVSGVQPSIGLTFAPSALWTFGTDYTFDNDVDGEDTGSFAVSHKLVALGLKLKLAGEKHSVYSLSVTRAF